MGRKDLERIVLEVEDGDEATVTDGLQPLERQLSFLLQAQVVARHEQVSLQELPKLVAHGNVVVVQQVLEGANAEGGLGPGGAQGRQLLLVV